MKKLIFAIFILFFSFYSFCFSQGPPPPIDQPGTGTDQVETLPNIPVFVILKRFGDLLFTFSLFLAFIFILYAGILYITSSGNPEQAEKAKKAVAYAVIGIFVAVAALGLVSVIKNYLTRGRG
jgi:hypothetical protein